ncbi:hypothetical protein Sjap_016361 [Stephania japonica]|uniref:CAAX prenyl protease 2/Lysostaphin resistance protein A-like domain-containing protein n=1 Tax=Stephania japonica TaxID=461633 RepID=A0AAP0NTE4_9MAGN
MESFTAMASRAHRGTIAIEHHHLFHSTKLKRKSWSVIKSFARQKKSVNKLKKGLKLNPERTQQSSSTSLDGFDGIENQSSEKCSESINENSNGVLRNPIPLLGSPRNAVLQACTVTSGLVLALGLAIRQISHVAVANGWPVLDCSMVSLDFQMWHLELIAALVIVITSSRYLLLQIWPDFAESSQAANQQVLSSLQPLDYIIVAFLPGVSEELLFRGALLPLFGLDFKSCALVAAIFGILHIGGGRKGPFAIWATFVGFAYGYATILSSSLIVPMASHGLNNLVGALMWRYLSPSSEEQ